MWVLLVIESQVVSFQPTKKDRQLSILARRALAYKQMNARLTDEATSVMDDFLLSVAIAGACEKRMGNPAIGEQHVRAVKRLLILRGGLHTIRDIIYPVGLMIVNILVENEVQNLFETREVLERRLDELVVERLRDQQRWNYHLRLHSKGTSFGKIRDYRRQNSTMDSEDAMSADCMARRSLAFTANTALYYYVALPSDDLDIDQCRFFLGILFTINIALYAFRDSARHTNRYLKGLTTAVEMSTPANFVLRAGGSKLPSLLMLIMIAHNAVDIEGRDSSTEIVFCVEEVFEFVNLIMMADYDYRVMVIRTLSSWLIAPFSNLKDLDYIDDAKLLGLAASIRENWNEGQT